MHVCMYVRACVCLPSLLHLLHLSLPLVAFRIVMVYFSGSPLLLFLHLHWWPTFLRHLSSSLINSISSFLAMVTFRIVMVYFNVSPLLYSFISFTSGLHSFTIPSFPSLVILILFSFLFLFISSLLHPL